MYNDEGSNVTQENPGFPGQTDKTVDALTETGSGRGGHAGRFREMYAAHGGAIYNYLLWMTKDADSSRDLLQTVFIRAWEAKALPGNDNALRRWLFTTARNAFFDSYRSHCRLSRLRAHYSREFYETQPEAPEGFFWDMLSECTESERSILYLHLKAGYSHAEIGSMLDLSESNVRVKTCRAIKRLRESYLRRKGHE
jgi:RNA polymerase sigma-70 factor, ECF subfamily